MKAVAKLYPVAVPALATASRIPEKAWESGKGLGDVLFQSARRHAVHPSGSRSQSCLLHARVLGNMQDVVQIQGAFVLLCDNCKPTLGITQAKESGWRGNPVGGYAVQPPFCLVLSINGAFCASSTKTGVRKFFNSLAAFLKTRCENTVVLLSLLDFPL